jgi:VanZ family protein
MALIFSLSSLSDPAALSPLRLEMEDTIPHLFVYLVLGLLLWRATRRGVGSTLAVGWAYGLLDEVHQAFVPARSAEARDLLADAVGVALGLILALFLSRRRRGG